VGSHFREKEGKIKLSLQKSGFSEMLDKTKKGHMLSKELQFIDGLKPWRNVHPNLKNTWEFPYDSALHLAPM
jgi:hypothetical protein